ncbi:MAG TPA: haloacid dehalogenase type II [Chthonomonadaceae bacterium]|nr:haloacid dehalogenase type II [Chthonomonadaceae bacterium]
MNFDNFKVLTFDCYGTLVDWETGILAALRPLFARRRIGIPDEDILAGYAIMERNMESAPFFMPYRQVLQKVMKQFGKAMHFSPTEAETNALVDSFAEWKPFPDTVAALQALKTRYKLVIISNVDDDLFAITAQYLQVPFDEVITAQQVGSYKPSHRNFETAFSRIGLPREQILHVAQSLHHDIAPARELGLANVWVTRRKGKTASGATDADAIQPDLEVPDLQSLATAMGLMSHS